MEETNNLAVDIITPKEQESSFKYNGLEVKGVQLLHEKAILTQHDVTQLLDRLPEGYFQYVPVSSIIFEPYKMFSVIRNGQVIYAKDTELLPTDKIIARKRGETTWNGREENGQMVATDGKMKIQIFSPKNWDDKNDPQIDKDTGLYSLAHEIGHSSWGAIAIGPAIWEGMRGRGMTAPIIHPNINKLRVLINMWRDLPESRLERFHEYSVIFQQDAKIDRNSEEEMKQLTEEEDFAISHENYLYWQNLADQDPERFETLDTIYQIM